MACVHPIPAWRDTNGQIKLSRQAVQNVTALRLPCGTCIKCRTAHARAWAFRCQLEMQEHDAAAFTTLTYDDEHLPDTLRKRDLQLFLKRLRKAIAPLKTRFFASGEYGEQNQRPHFHAILYGLHNGHRDLIHDEWGKGRTHTVDATPATIGYTAGYTAKKIDYRHDPVDVIDYNTGELLWEWQPPFIQMSRRPGIGGAARQFVQSWRTYAVSDGNKLPVPRFLHNAWLAQASPSDLEELAIEKTQFAATRDTSVNRLKAAEQIAISKHRLQSEKRKL